MDLSARELALIEDALSNLNDEARNFMSKHTGVDLLQTEVRLKVLELHDEIVALLDRVRVESGRQIEKNHVETRVIQTPFGPELEKASK